jgi:hypothetical protein
MPGSSPGMTSGFGGTRAAIASHVLPLHFNSRMVCRNNFALAAQRARAMHKFFRPRRGRRERRVPAAPAAPCAKVESTGVEATGTPEHPAFPAQWF